MTQKEKELTKIRNKYLSIKSCLSEKGRRLWAAVESRAYGRGGITLVCKAIGMSNTTVHKGLKELTSPDSSANNERVRKSGGGRKLLIDKYPKLIKELDLLVDPYTKGDPESPLRWTSKSTRKLAKSLQEKGYSISHNTVGLLLHDLGYSLQANKKTLEKGNHPDRDDQFRYINTSVIEAQNKHQPAISVDTKKKELIGNYKNSGKEYMPKGKPIKVKGHDFIDKKLGKIAPYGVYDIGKNKGWVSIGISSDTAEFAVNTIRTWWLTDGMKRYPKASELIITADCGGSNGYRTRLWKLELQKLANELNLKIKVRHFPPGTSKWNKIEHRLFSYISKNWRGQPLINIETVINLIGNTTTTTGLTVTAVLDKNTYEKGIEVTKKDMDAININGDKFHPEWNYTIENSA
ncbi:MAG: ISAzo13 family transposase [Flavobacteriaceae bacterium]|nr:ISAzo13 family transposase [Flavobacteriaceae bacterium]